MKEFNKETNESGCRTLGVLSLVLLAGVTLSTSALADMSRMSLIRDSFHEVSRGIHQLMSSNPDSQCLGDLDVAAAHVDAAEMMLGRNKVWSALMEMEQARYELYGISVDRPDCAPLASSVKHILANLIRAKGEIEADELNMMH